MQIRGGINEFRYIRGEQSLSPLSLSLKKERKENKNREESTKKEKKENELHTD